MGRRTVKKERYVQFVIGDKEQKQNFIFRFAGGKVLPETSKEKSH